jgi:type I restriction enzyme M protein
MTEAGMAPLREAQADGRWLRAYTSRRQPGDRNAILGAIAGDIIGSRFEFNNIKTKKFDLFGPGCFATDDSIMTLAVGKAILNCRGDSTNLGREAVARMQEVGRPYPDCGYGGRFFGWMYSDTPAPYGSFGNGAAMRVAACAQAARTLEEAKDLCRRVTEVTHNHPEGLKGAEATVVAAFLAGQDESPDEIRKLIHENYYPMDFTLDEIRDSYAFNETCQETVPQAIRAFLEADGYEDAIRNAISIGGDSDTLAAITGAVAAACYGVPGDIRYRALGYLDGRLLGIYQELEDAWRRETS